MPCWLNPALGTALQGTRPGIDSSVRFETYFQSYTAKAVPKNPFDNRRQERAPNVEDKQERTGRDRKCRPITLIEMADRTLRRVRKAWFFKGDDMQFALIEGKRCAPTKGAAATCPGCGADMIARCGEVKTWHWAHRPGSINRLVARLVA